MIESEPVKRLKLTSLFEEGVKKERDLKMLIEEVAAA